MDKESLIEKYGLTAYVVMRIAIDDVDFPVLGSDYRELAARILINEDASSIAEKALLDPSLNGGFQRNNLNILRTTIQEMLSRKAISTALKPT